MSFMDRGDDEFEQALLRSASRDAPPLEASERAWLRFATLMAGVALVDVPSRPVGPTGTASIGRAGSPFAAMKWLALGAIGGSAVTLALVGLVGRPAVSPAPAASATTAFVTPAPLGLGAPTLPSPRPSVSVAPEAPPVSTVATPAPGAGTLPRRGRPSTVGIGSSTVGVSAALDDDASLAAEVAALDVVRRALDAGAADGALTLLERYALRFPKGKLAPESDVLHIEAVAAKGDRPRVAAEAARFLERYPDAPQRARVEQLRDGVGFRQ